MRKIVSFITVIAFVLGLFAGCSGDSSDSSSSEQGTGASKGDIVYVNADGDAVYRVIRPQESDGSNAAQKVFKAFKDLGIRMVSTTDWEDGTDMFEILVGNTNRQETETAKNLLIEKTGGRYEDYIICSMYIRLSMANSWESAPYAAVEGTPEDWTNTNKLKVDWINIYQYSDAKSIMHCGPMSTLKK